MDPIGACVGLRGTRIQVIVRELRGEKIDIIEWSDDLSTLVARALSPAKVASVTVEREGEERTALVVVPDNQLSLAIGKKGQNARLAAKLTGLRIDVKSESELESERQRVAEERERGLAGLVEIAEIGPRLAPGLVEHGLDSPAKVRQAGPAGLTAAGVPEGDVPGILAAVDAWLAARVREPGAAVEPPGAGGVATPLLPAPSLFHSLPHQLSQYCAFVLPAKRLIKGFLDIGWYAEVHGGHGTTPIVEYFNNRMTGYCLAVKREGLRIKPK